MPVIGAAVRKGIDVIAADPARAFLPLRGRRTTSGVHVAPSTGMAAAAVYAAASIRSDVVASLPVKFVERDDEHRRPVYPDVVRPLWDQPNALHTVQQWIAIVQMSRMLWGNSYNYVRWTNGDDVYDVWPLDPDRVTDVDVMRDSRGRYGIRYRVADWTENDGWVENAPGQRPQMLHIPLVVKPGALKGLSPIEVQAELVGMSLSSQEHAARFMGEGVSLSGTIEVGEDLEQADAKEVWENFMLQHAGPSKAGHVGVLTGGAKFVPQNIPPQALQFLEQQKYTDRKIASIFRTPPHLVGDTEPSTSWGTGIEEQTKAWVQFTLLPDVIGIEQAVARTLLAGTTVQMKFNVNALLRGSVKDRAELYRQLWSMSAANADEIRAHEDMGPLADGMGQRYYVPANMVAVAAGRKAVSAEVANAIGVLFRSGYTPEGIAEALGITEYEHTGLLPVTLRADDDGEPPPLSSDPDDEGAGQ